MSCLSCTPTCPGCPGFDSYPGLSYREFVDALSLPNEPLQNILLYVDVASAASSVGCSINYVVGALLELRELSKSTEKITSDIRSFAEELRKLAIEGKQIESEHNYLRFAPIISGPIPKRFTSKPLVNSRKRRTFRTPKRC